MAVARRSQGGERHRLLVGGMGHGVREPGKSRMVWVASSEEGTGWARRSLGPGPGLAASDRRVR